MIDVRKIRIGDYVIFEGERVEVLAIDLVREVGTMNGRQYKVLFNRDGVYIQASPEQLHYEQL